MVEVLLELCHGWCLPFSLLALVPEQQAGLGRYAPYCRVSDLHEHDIDRLWYVMWFRWLLELPRLLSAHLRCRQGGLRTRPGLINNTCTVYYIKRRRVSQNKLHWYITVRPAYEMTDQREITALCAGLHASRHSASSSLSSKREMVDEAQDDDISSLCCLHRLQR